MKLSFVLLLAVVAFVTQAGLLTKEEKMKCYTEASDKVKTEPDADLKEKITSTLTAVKGVADNVKSLTDAQKQRIVSHYFTGTCEPLKNFFQ
ncbi:hypothetical protein PENTCL1PPCAC_11840 [Pristionchus entomophagus]|uniref:Uncharacterized protein n=1 Tax=Pristionchus entomophagus TaxID=358040 RepID=A0AAV5T3M1_9BILA|nr:hypothetical protein PENTCL1PPCAC_11840 [Pristionchus entomophagus]